MLNRILYSTKASRESSTTNQLLWELVNKVGDCLGTKEKEQLYVLLQEYADVLLGGKEIANRGPMCWEGRKEPTVSFGSARIEIYK